MIRHSTTIQPQIEIGTHAWVEIRETPVSRDCPFPLVSVLIARSVHLPEKKVTSQATTTIGGSFARATASPVTVTVEVETEAPHRFFAVSETS